MTSAGDVYSYPGAKLVFETGEDISKGDVVYVSDESNTYLAVVKRVTEADKPAIGVALETVKGSGNPIAVLVGAPVVYVTTGAPVTVGEYLVGSDATVGTVEPLSVTSTGVQYICGIALKSASDGGEVIPMLLIHGAQCGGEIT